jgi:hypothetical protein
MKTTIQKQLAISFTSISLLLASFTASATPVNLIVNGSFESGNFSQNSIYPGRMQLSDGSLVIDNWVVGAPAGNFWWMNSPNNAADGVRSANLDSNGQTPTYIEQSFATTAGQQYWVTAAFSSEGNGGPATTGVSINGSLIGTATVGSGIGEAGDAWSDLVWITQSFSFTAASATSTLRFQDATPFGQFYNPLVDDVSVVLATPDQASTLTLAFASLSGCLAFRRRRVA